MRSQIDFRASLIPSPLINVTHQRLPDKVDDSLSGGRADGFVVDHDDLIAWQQLPLRRAAYVRADSH